MKGWIDGRSGRVYGEGWIEGRNGGGRQGLVTATISYLCSYTQHATLQLFRL